MEFLTEILWVFTVFSFLGWLVQFVPRIIKEKKLRNPGFLTLPFLPSHGIGMALVFILFSGVKSLFVLFFGSAIMLTLYKYTLSMIFEKSCGFKWKDYSKKRFSLNGYVSVWEPFVYGALGLLAVKFCFAPLAELVRLLPWWVSLLIPGVIVLLIAADFVISFITVINLRRNLKKMNDISELIEENDEDEFEEELKKNYELRMLKSKKFRLRLVAAFPDMESLNYEKQLSDIKKHFNLIREKNNETYEKKIENVEERPFAYGLCFSKLFWLFLIGSVFGTFLETLWSIFIDGHLEMRVGLLIGPFIPVYGGGAVVITLCLYKLHKSGDLVVYLASAVIGATFEYLCSYFQETFLGTVSWDYSDTPFNLHGRTNLTYALIWGILGLVWLRYLYPLISRMIERIPKKPGKIITIILVVFMALDSALSIIAITRYADRKDNIAPKTVIGETIDTVFNDDYMNFVFPHMAKPGEFANNEKMIEKSNSD